MKNFNEANLWFGIADSDIRAANHLLSLIPIPFAIICYHCQQCAEKYLKGYLTFNGTHPPKTHNLLLLARRCAEFDVEFNDLRDDCAELNSYGVEVRYPYFEELNKTDVLRAIKSADNIKSFVLEKVK
ncbi:HEPN domain-containing protein [Bacillus mycoides]|uniref:HEPN domain-containing protein n=1 Tax=Bacillus mycoides TaxID=1405 RepID=UPI003D1D837E